VRYDSILAYIPEENIEQWIEREAAKYGYKREIELDEYGKSWAVSESVREVWNVSGTAAKKLTAIIIVIGVEFGILMLALLSREPSTQTNFGSGRLRPLIREFGKDAIQDFISESRDAFFETGKLPMARDLSRKDREIRKFIADNFNEDDLTDLMESVRR